MALLTAQGLALDGLPPVGHTALFRSAGANGDSMRRALLESGASVLAPSVQDKTPLHAAAAHGHIDALDDFIRRGALVDACDGLDLTPMHYLLIGMHAGVPPKPQAVRACMERLLTAGADVHLAASALDRGWSRADGAGWQILQGLIVRREKAVLANLPFAHGSPTARARV